MNKATDDQPAAGQTEQFSIGSLGNGREVTRLRLLFLAPLAAAIFAIVAVLVFALYWHEHKAVDQGVLRIRASAQDFYEDSIRYDARALQAVMDALKHDHVLNEALARRDRQQLLAHSSVMFDELKRDFAITHLYFSGPDRVNLLRVHTPNRHGDRIDRFTTLAAEKDGTTSHGVELGPLGTFTLRLVSPWYDEATRQLIGYVEVGMEIDRVLQKLREFFGIEVFVLVHKDKLERQKWENGMRTLGRTPDWDRFPTMVLGTQAHQNVPPLLAARLGRNELGDASTIINMAQGGASYRAAFLPLQDAGGRTVAHMVLLTDVSQDLDEATDTVYAGSIAAVVAGILLFGFFHWQVGRVGRRIERNEQELKEIATHDRLTGAWNRRQFDELLAREMNRARRHNLPLSLIMFDIDHFKKVNDTWGHQAGDDLLATLSVYVSANIRDIDMLARWGGEEFMVITPDTGSEAARRLAEKLRALIEYGNFGEAGRITCSFGVTQFRPGDTAEDFTGRADAVMYQAKQGGRNRVCGDEDSAQAG
jgi:diguanylate cyclase (GGDEF)-like protein